MNERATRLEGEVEHYRHIFETSLDLILVTDGRGAFVEISPSCTATLGYRREEMLGHTGAEFIHPADLESTRAEMRRARRGREMRNFPCRYVHKDGHAISLAWTGIWSEREQKHFFIGRDMTVQNELAQAERCANDMLAAVIDASPVAILCLAPDQTVMVWSRAAEQIFGYTAEEVLGKHYMLVPLQAVPARRAGQRGRKGHREKRLSLTHCRRHCRRSARGCAA